MADRLFFTDGGQIGQSRHVIEFSFTANGASNPTAVQNASNCLASIVYAATGKYTVTLSSRDFYNAVCFASAEMEDIASPDGAYCSVGIVGNEGTSSALTFVVSTFNAGGTLTQYTNRRIWVSLTVRNTAMAGSTAIAGTGGTP